MSATAKEVLVYKPCGKSLCKNWLAKRGSDPSSPTVSDCNDCENGGPIQWWHEQEKMPNIEMDGDV